MVNEKRVDIFVLLVNHGVVFWWNVDEFGDTGKKKLREYRVVALIFDFIFWNLLCLLFLKNFIKIATGLQDDNWIKFLNFS